MDAGVTRTAAAEEDADGRRERERVRRTGKEEERGERDDGEGWRVWEVGERDGRRASGGERSEGAEYERDGTIVAEKEGGRETRREENARVRQSEREQHVYRKRERERERKNGTLSFSCESERMETSGIEG